MSVAVFIIISSDCRNFAAQNRSVRLCQHRRMVRQRKLIHITDGKNKKRKSLPLHLRMQMLSEGRVDCSYKENCDLRRTANYF